METDMLDGKVALVTGASSGIGAATAEALAGAGASVVLAARRADRLADLATRLSDKGATVLSVVLDVTDERACQAAVARTVDELGGLDILINNAGVMLLGLINQADTTDWTRMINTNLLGSMFMVHSSLPHLLARKGSIVQISSVAGRVVRAGGGAYAATKFGIGAFAESLRQEVTTKGVRVVVIEPGVVDTELREHITDQQAAAALAARIKDNRNLQSDDVAAAVLYAVTQPDHVAINEITLRPTDQGW
jgi:NADP-dependent 3-hydroxy acid dehydrogenase YdfG